MSAAATPFGLRPVYHPSGLDRAQAYYGGIQTGYASSIYQGSPVIMATTGFLTIGTTAADWLGVFAGVEYTDANGRTQVSKFWPANMAATNIIAYVYVDPAIVYEIQSSGSLAQSSIGDQADFVNPGNGNTVPGISTATINSSLAGSGAQGQMRILDFAHYVDNAWGDAYTIVQVQNARSQYVANKVAF